MTRTEAKYRKETILTVFRVVDALATHKAGMNFGRGLTVLEKESVEELTLRAAQVMRFLNTTPHPAALKRAAQERKELLRAQT